MKKYSILTCVLFLLTCLLSPGCHTSERDGIPHDIKQILSGFGGYAKNFQEVIDHYRGPNDSLKLQAAYYLIRNCADHIYYDGPNLKYYNDILPASLGQSDKKKFIINNFDSLNHIYGTNDLVKKWDYEILSAPFLEENIDYAFKAWQLPWCRNLSFTEFCEYILPYKVSTEKPVAWRKKVFDQLAWLKDSLHDGASLEKVCSIVNDTLKWFKFQFPFDYPTALNYDDLVAGKTGKCSDACALTVYTMRAAGIPVNLDYTPQWATRSYGHSWNTLVTEKNKSICFQGTETDPGLTKIEYDPNEEWFFKRAKIYRSTFTKTAKNLDLLTANPPSVPEPFRDEFYKDVTADFIPTTDISIQVDKSTIDSRQHFAYLCVFDNQKWFPVDWGRIEGRTVTFREIGTGILCLAASISTDGLSGIAPPFRIADNGDLSYFIPNPSQPISATLFRKYPYNNSNEIKTGDRYELFYWDNRWISLGEKKAMDKSLTYHNIPGNSVLLLRDLDRGKQERPFTIENEKQIFW